jgi:hypothetical protein
MIYNAAQANAETAIEKALRSSDKDSSYPAWSDLYARDVVSRQSQALGAQLTDILVDTLPVGYVADPSFDFGVEESTIDLVAEMGKQDPGKRAKLDGITAELMANFGAHSRNLVRGVLKQAQGPETRH